MFTSVEINMKDNNYAAVIQELTPIFRDVFDDDQLMIDAQTSAKDVDGWDSLLHIRLIFSIEKNLALRFSASEVSRLENVGEMAELVVKKRIDSR